MKLCRYGEQGSERPGVVGEDGRLRDLSSVCSDIDGHLLSPRSLAALAAIDIAALPLVDGAPRLGPPVNGTSKIICIGLNYHDHAKETGATLPDQPLIFLKPPSAICGPNDGIIKPVGSTRLDWEVELGVVIGTRASYVDEDDAMSHVAGYCLVNDVSERLFQRQTSQWAKGKGCDSFAPIGPWLVTADDVPNPQALAMWLDVNDVRMQDGSSADMIFSVGEIVSYCSQYMTLMPGDIIFTGTPAGVAAGMAQPAWLKAGDRLAFGIEGLGEQRHLVRDAQPAAGTS